MREHCLVYAIFDCCRTFAKAAPEQSRIVRHHKTIAEGFGWFMVNGCLMGDTTPGVSKLATDACYNLLEVGDKNKGMVRLPSDISPFKCTTNTPHCETYMESNVYIELKKPDSSMTAEMKYLRDVPPVDLTSPRNLESTAEDDQE